MAKRIAAPAAPTGTQRQILKALTAGRFSCVLERHCSDNVWLSKDAGAAEEKVLPATFHALERHGWIEEIATWSTSWVTYWQISEAGQEALR